MSSFVRPLSSTLLVLLSSVAAPPVAPLAAQPAPGGAAPARVDPFCWRGRPFPRCRAFALFELGVYGGLATTRVRRHDLALPPGVAQPAPRDAFETQLSWSVGAMRNVDSTTALGGALVLAAAGEGATVAATARVRRWTGRLTSVELAAGPGVSHIPLPPTTRTVDGVPLYGSVPDGWRPSLLGEARANLGDLAAVSLRGVVVPRAGGRTHAALYGGASVGSGLAVAGSVGLGVAVALLIAALASGDF